MLTGLILGYMYMGQLHNQLHVYFPGMSIAFLERRTDIIAISMSHVNLLHGDTTICHVYGIFDWYMVLVVVLCVQ